MDARPGRRAATGTARHADPGARAAIARIGAALEASLGLKVETGWATYEPVRDAHAVGPLMVRALALGAHERERFAFFSAVGHELRTPLASIRGYLETLLECEEPLEPHVQRRFTAIAHREALRLSRLIEGMFEISMLDLRPTAGAAARASLPAVFNAVRDATLNGAKAREVSIAIVSAEELDVAIDPDRLILILVNLIENAVKHGRRGGCVHVAAELAQDLISITVDDDGSGVPIDARERIFELGMRGRTAADGTGIGLTLARLLAERAGGRVEACASPLGGARFAISLRRVVEVATPARVDNENAALQRV